MDKPEQWKFGTGLTLAFAGVGLSFAGREVETQLIEAVLGLLGVFLMISSFRPTFANAPPGRWLRSRSRGPRVGSE